MVMRVPKGDRILVVNDDVHVSFFSSLCTQFYFVRVFFMLEMCKFMNLKVFFH